MIFLLCLAIAQWLVLTHVVRIVTHAGDSAGNLNEELSTTAVMIVGAALMGLPLLEELITLATLSNGEAVTATDDYRPLWLLGVGGFLSASVFAFRLVRQHMRGRTGFRAIGVNALGLMLALYMLVVVGDQVRFLSGPDDDIGMLNWSFLRDNGSVTDIQCEMDMVVVKGFASDSATYRCPQEPLAIMGRFSGIPIVPWPTYTEGVSRQLPPVIAAMLSNAVRADSPTQ